MAAKSLEIAAVARLDRFFERVGAHLKDRRKRESFALYAFGILGDGERKSVEPIAAKACADPSEVNNMHSKLLYFLGQSRWDDRAVRLEAARYAIEAAECREPVTTWIVDDTGFLKQGTHSVGVHRQYTGSAGKVTNCQVAVSLAVATASEQIPIDFELYLPEAWANDPALRAEARVPTDVAFKTKIELAIDMIERASAAHIPGNVVLADSAYGSSSEFRAALRVMDFDFALGVTPQLGVSQLKNNGMCGPSVSALELVQQLKPSAFRKVTWRSGTKSDLSSRFCFVRVRTTQEDGLAIEQREPLWLVAEWPHGEKKPTKFFLTTLPQRMSNKQIVRIIKERWRTERMYEDLKGELGLDHFEGRSFPGWHHHISVVLCCYAFVSAERARAFPPSEGRKSPNRQVQSAA